MRAASLGPWDRNAMKTDQDSTTIRDILPKSDLQLQTTIIFQIRVKKDKIIKLGNESHMPTP